MFPRAAELRNAALTAATLPAVGVGGLFQESKQGENQCSSEGRGKMHSIMTVRISTPSAGFFLWRLTGGMATL